jgi:hypothetical protein
MGLLKTFRGWFNFCETCGTKMVHFRHPSRWRCPNEDAHAAILGLAAQEQRRRSGHRRSASKRRRDREGRFR